jgi:hypothetical protein
MIRETGSPLFRIMLYGLVFSDTDEYGVAVLLVIMLFVVDKNVL